MEVFVRGCNIGQRFTVICDIDDDVEVLIDRYVAVSGETIDRNVFKYVLTCAGRVGGESDLLTDLGISHESTVSVSIQKRKIEFKTVDYQKLLSSTHYDGWGTQKPLVPSVHDRVNEGLNLTLQDLSSHIREMSFEALVPIYFAIADDWVIALRDIYDNSKEINDFIEKVHPCPEIRRQEIYRLPIVITNDITTNIEKKRLLAPVARGLLYPYDIVTKLIGKEVNEGWEIVHIDATSQPSVIFKRVI